MIKSLIYLIIAISIFSCKPQEKKNAVSKPEIPATSGIRLAPDQARIAGVVKEYAKGKYMFSIDALLEVGHSFKIVLLPDQLIEVSGELSNDAGVGKSITCIIERDDAENFRLIRFLR